MTVSPALIDTNILCYALDAGEAGGGSGTSLTVLAL